MSRKNTISELDAIVSDSDDFELDIPHQNESNLMEDYLNCRYNQIQAIDILPYHDKNQRIQTIEDMKNNPHYYFNFGMSFNDYKAFVQKIIFMRAERQLIEKMLGEHAKVDNNQLEQSPHSNQQNQQIRQQQQQ